MPSVRLKVDVRERGLIPLLSEGLPLLSEGIALDVEALDVGDIQVWIDDVKWMVYERKTHGDLVASLNSGRYAEQRERLKAWAAQQQQQNRPAMILYVLEGVDTSACPRIAACVNAMLAVHRMSPVRTRSLEDTARHVLDTARTLKRRLDKGTMPSDPGSADAGIREHAECAGVAYQKRANVLTPGACWVRQLCCVPGVGPGVADRIAQAYPGMADLCRMAQAAGSPEAAADQLSRGVPGVGPKIAQKVIHFTVPSD